MAISFNEIPANIRQPLFYAEIDNSRANKFSQNLKSLLIGQSVLPMAVEPLLITSVDQAKNLFGNGSMLARMVESYRKNDRFGELWCLPLGNPVSTTEKTIKFLIDAPISGSGLLSLYVAGELLKIVVPTGSTSEEISNLITAAINANVDLPVSAVASLTVTHAIVTLTAKNGGEISNSIDVQFNFNNQLGSEKYPENVQPVIETSVTGVGSPDIEAALATLGDLEFEYIGHPYTDTTSMTFFRDEMVRRWAFDTQLYGHVFTALQGSTSALNTIGDGLNDQHTTLFGYYGSPSWAPEVVSAGMAQIAASANIDPARPFQTLPLIGVVPAKLSQQFTKTEINTLLYSGITPINYSGGYARIVRAITTYQQNVYGQPDISYLDATTMFTLARIVRELRLVITSKFPRHKLANDGTSFGAGQAVVTPKTIKAEIIALYERLETLGLVENISKFKEELIVERNDTDPSRLDVLLPPDLIQGLVVFASQVQFRLAF